MKTKLVLVLLSAISCNQAKIASTTAAVISADVSLEELFTAMTSTAPNAVAARAAAQAKATELGALSPANYFAYLKDHTDNAVYVVDGQTFSGLRDLTTKQEDKYLEADNAFANMREMWATNNIEGITPKTMADLHTGIQSMHEILYQGNSLDVALALASDSSSWTEKCDSTHSKQCQTRVKPSDCGWFWQWLNSACYASNEQCGQCTQNSGSSGGSGGSQSGNGSNGGNGGSGSRSGSGGSQSGSGTHHFCDSSTTAGTHYSCASSTDTVKWMCASDANGACVLNQ